MGLMRTLQQSIERDEFPQFVQEFMLTNYPDRQYPDWVVEALASVNITLN